MAQASASRARIIVETEAREPRVGASHRTDVLRELTEEEYAQWDRFIDSSPQSSVFFRSWWLKATSDNFSILGLFSGGRLIAGMPLCFKRRYGLSICTMPQLTQTLGVAMEPLSGKRSSVSTREIEILKSFADLLGKQFIFRQAFHPTIQNWLPFYWSGFKQTTLFTYVFDDLHDLNKIWEEVGHRPRSEIRKAERQGITITPCSIETMLDLESRTFARQNLVSPHSSELLKRVYAAVKTNDAGECFAAKDQRSKVHAAGFIVWDRSRTYYVASGGDPELRASGATALLAWHLIQFASRRSRVFDFEGSMLQSIERQFRNFGAKPLAYSVISKCPFWFLLASGRNGRK